MSKRIAAYIEKRSVLAQWPVDLGDVDGVKQVVVIPARAEYPGLLATLDDLAAAPPAAAERSLIICVVNNPVDGHAEPGEIENNQETLEVLAAWKGPLRLLAIDASTPGRALPPKEGVGLARKIGLDWGLSVLQRNGLPHAPLICLDADTRVPPDYLVAVQRFFAAGDRWAAIINFEHPIEERPMWSAGACSRVKPHAQATGLRVPPKVGQGPPDPALGKGGAEDQAGSREPWPTSESAAILCYEIFLRYHELGLAYAGSPYAFTAMGSAMACTVEAYAAVSGMNRRLAGEDFYFLQQLAKTGPVERLRETTVIPSPRSSYRVPFGTGRRVNRFLGGGQDEYRLYAPETYDILRAWLALIVSQTSAPSASLLDAAGNIDAALRGFLETQHFARIWDRLRSQHREAPKLIRAFHGWFDGFRTLKLAHHLRDHGHPESESFSALAGLGGRIGINWPQQPRPAFRCDLAAQAEVLACLRRRCRKLPPVLGLSGR